MKKRYVAAFIIAFVFLIIAVFVMNLNTVEYANFSQVKKNDKIMQVIGKPDKINIVNTGSSLKFSFYMTDKENKTVLVNYNGAKPMNFDLAVYVVVKGKFEGESFTAKEILTKCPSKYEGELEKTNQKVN